MEAGTNTNADIIKKALQYRRSPDLYPQPFPRI